MVTATAHKKSAKADAGERRKAPGRTELLERFRDMALAVNESAKRGHDPAIEIPVRALSNVNFNAEKRIIEMGRERQSRNFFSTAMAKKFMQTMLVASKCRQLVEEDKTTSIRDLFYMAKHTVAGTRDENTFDEQDESDDIIEDLEVTLDALREELHLMAASRGAFIGDLVIRDNREGEDIDCTRLGRIGLRVPSIVEPSHISFKRCKAKYVLLVEKEAVWHRLVEDSFWKKQNCLLITGNGQPPRSVRRLCNRFVRELNLPLYVFTDNDPWGYYIHSVVKQGSINLAYESRRMAIPKARFLGLRSGDRIRYKLPDDVTLKLNDEDQRRIKQIQNYPWFESRAWQKELKEMKSSGVKLEQEALSKKSVSFVSEEYLPRKIRDKDFLD